MNVAILRNLNYLRNQKFPETVRRTADRIKEDRAEKARALPQGNVSGTLSISGEIGTDARSAINVYLGELYASIRNTMDSMREHYQGESIKPISPEAMSLLQGFKLRSSLAQHEVDAAVSKYGNNPQFLSTLSDIALEQKLNCPRPAFVSMMEAIDRAEAQLNRCASRIGNQHENASLVPVYAREIIDDLIAECDRAETSHEQE